MIDEILSVDLDKIKVYLDANFEASGVDQLYWIPLEKHLLTSVQAEHTECHPLCFAVELDSGQMNCELLLRTKNRLKCDCMGYATHRQRNWFIDLIDGIFKELSIHP